MVSPVGIIYSAAIMSQAVGNSEIECVKRHVVAHYLVKHCLGYVYARSFVFHYQQRFSFRRESHGVASAFSAVDLDAYFVGK